MSSSVRSVDYYQSHQHPSYGYPSYQKPRSLYTEPQGSFIYPRVEQLKPSEEVKETSNDHIYFILGMLLTLMNKSIGTMVTVALSTQMIAPPVALGIYVFCAILGVIGLLVTMVPALSHAGEHKATISDAKAIMTILAK